MICALLARSPSSAEFESFFLIIFFSFERARSRALLLCWTMRSLLVCLLVWSSVSVSAFQTLRVARIPPSRSSVTRNKPAPVWAEKAAASSSKADVAAPNKIPWLAMIVSFTLGYRLAARRLQQALLRAAVDPASGIVVSNGRPPYVLATLLAVGLLRELYRNLPMWVRKQVWSLMRLQFLRRRAKEAPKVSATSASTTTDPSSSSVHNDNPTKPTNFLANKATDLDDIDPDDLTSLPALAAKLNGLWKTGQTKLDTTTSLGNNAQIAFVAALKIISVIKELHPEARDDQYVEGTQEDESRSVVLEGLDDWFELADAAYDEWEEDGSLREALHDRGYTLLRHDPNVLPGAVAHYVALQKDQKVAVVGVKGTSGLEDLLTDCCGQVVSQTVEGSDIRCHEGIWLASKRLAEDLDPLVSELLIPSGYRMVLTGHSLGAGTAALTGLILRSKYPELRDDLQVYAFASPPVLNYDAAMACEGFCTTIVNNADIIPRASLSNLLVLVQFLQRVYEKLEAQDLVPQGLGSTAAFWKAMLQSPDALLKKDGSALFMSEEEFREGLEQAYEAVEINDPDHLFVPGRVLHMYDLWSKERGPQSSPIQDIRSLLESRPTNETETVEQPVEKVRIADCASRPLRLIELDSRMLSDHMSPAYRSSLKSLLGTRTIATDSAPLS